MEYIIFKFLWIVVLLPKSAQLICFGTLTLLLLYKSRQLRKIKKDTVNFTFISTNSLFLFSIVISIILQTHDVQRILAAINTCLISYVAILLYNSYSKINLNYEKISKYMFINFIILIFIWIAYKTIGLKAPLILGNSIGGNDYIYGLKTTRFSAYLDYVNLVVYLILYIFPLSLYYASKKFSSVGYLIYSILPILIIVSTNSRLGLPVAILVSVVAIGIKYYKRFFDFYKRNRKVVVFFLMLISIILIMIFESEIAEIISNVLIKRQGSTEARKTLYIVSMKKMLIESPLFGCGVKDIWNGLPYGSHSTYLGMFYKTGIIGGTVFLYGIIALSVKILKKKIYTRNIFLLKVIYFCILVVSFLEDLDGANWNIVLFLIFLSILMNHDLKAYEI